jgi:hypothetical protein
VIGVTCSYIILHETRRSTRFYAYPLTLYLFLLYFACKLVVLYGMH